jgi:hypothetical protein
VLAPCCCAAATCRSPRCGGTGARYWALLLQVREGSGALARRSAGADLLQDMWRCQVLLVR